MAKRERTYGNLRGGTTKETQTTTQNRRVNTDYKTDPDKLYSATKTSTGLTDTYKSVRTDTKNGTSSGQLAKRKKTREEVQAQMDRIMKMRAASGNRHDALMARARSLVQAINDHDSLGEAGNGPEYKPLKWKYYTKGGSAG